MQDASYLNIDTGERETVFFFMLNAYLLSRIDTEHESTEDEEVNVYMAGLLQSLVDGSFQAGHGEWLATTPTDVFSKVEEGDTNRHRLEVYRSNADYRMIAFGLFAGFGEHRSERSLTASGDAKLEEAQQYYGWAANVLYQNQGDGHFVDITQAAGMADPGRPSLAAVWGDYDNDGDPDLYVANDSAPNYLYRNYRNGGDGTFMEFAAVVGVATDRDGRPQAGMGCAFEDYDNDGWLDLFVTNFASDSSTLYRNNGPGSMADEVAATRLHFTDVSYELGLGAATWAPLSWGTGFADFDHDGDKDLFIANGHVYPAVDGAGAGSYAQHNQLFESTEEGFAPVADAGPGLLVRKVSRGAIFGDYDDDGDLDIFIADLDDEPTLLRNDTPVKGHYLLIKTVGTSSNRDGVGTRIVVKAGSSTQIRQIRAGDGFLTRSDARAHFGLGSHAYADLVELHWPSGQVDRIADVAADRVIVVEEGVGVTSMPVLGFQ